MFNSRVFVAVLLAFPLTVMAYVDPGSGMLLWQGLLAAIGAGIIFVRRPWQALKRFVNRLRNK